LPVARRPADVFLNIPFAGSHEFLYVALTAGTRGTKWSGRTKEEARTSLADAIALILEDRREDGLRGVPADAERETVIVL
jgi:siroheme synthase (precorrin-2 oxidase/ferrochelatase)